jgi:hypothetical protein
LKFGIIQTYFDVGPPADGRVAQEGDLAERCDVVPLKHAHVVTGVGITNKYLKKLIFEAVKVIAKNGIKFWIPTRMEVPTGTTQK